MKTLTIGISPCPNDTYIFEAIYHEKVFVEGVKFKFIFEDVQKLNELASRNELDIVKVSYAHFFSLMENYNMLRSGGAMGFGVGPLLVAKENISFTDLKTIKTAIPGINTTANFLLSFYNPEIQNKIEYSFDGIENAILKNKVSAGVIIHENRFTYEQKGLLKLQDLGAYWEQQTSMPIPLGGIAVSNKLETSLQQSIDNMIKQSISIARMQNKLSDFVKSHAQEMHTDVMQKHIDLYVNDFSYQINDAGEQAVYKMYEVLTHTKIQKPIFIPKHK